ncbi:hypothetical protein DL764_003808 [Monosporascus ibericus]|uniref:Malonyl-CoA:ACP transacylase (MAT) domain-containing protein n=1 Tax=Monosporascus ibericus TaxID=155417 RepID=A0A4V1XB94_9PEZI|nr:hypothetical protein DL764_003808 [Monosporascus ibericus]
MLGDAPERKLSGSDPRSTHPVVISAKSKNSLKDNLTALVEYLDKHPDTDLVDGILLAGKRVELVVSKCEEGGEVMLAVRASVDKIKSIATNGKYHVSCMNGTDDTVLGGPREDIQDTRKALERESVKCTLLGVPFAFHTSQMDPMLGPFEQLAHTTEWNCRLFCRYLPL